MEKYKRRLEESSSLRRDLKELEGQNAELVDRNAALESEVAKLAEGRPLLEEWRKRVEQVEAQNRALEEELATQRYNLEQTAAEVKALEEARSKDAEQMSTLQERAEELELSGERSGASSVERDDSDGDADEEDLAALSSTALKLRIHSLTREVRRLKGGDGSRLAALEHLLADAQRSRKRYEEDYWAEYRARLKLAGEMERIRKAAGSGKGGKMEEGQSALAWRMRAEEVEEELQGVKRRWEEAKEEFEQSEKDLGKARTDREYPSPIP